MCEVMPDGDVSVRELRNHTAEVLRRVEAGERVRITVDRRPWPIEPLPQRTIASVAEAHDVPIYSHDAEFEPMPGAEVVRV